MKKVLSVQDLSCVGKCSLSVALPVLSAMGHSCSVLPTAVLSTHTAFPQPHVRSLTDDMTAICDHWKRIGAEFDAITIGYLSHPAQAASAAYLLENFPAFTVVDPAMGDHGKLYSGLSTDHVAAVKDLCSRANVLLPNVTEACLLTGMEYREAADLSYYRQLLDSLAQFGADTIILTGIAPDPDTTGFVGADKTAGQFCRLVPRQPKKCHGTGDLFTAVFAGSVLQGKSVSEAAECAAEFTEKVIAATAAASPFGIAFEPLLPLLWTT